MRPLDRTRLVALTVAVTLVPFMTACSEEEPQGFTPDNRTGFLAACTEPVEDSRLTSAICQCVFDETQAQLSFERFRAIDEAMVFDPDAELPPEVLDIIAECVIEEADL